LSRTLTILFVIAILTGSLIFFVRPPEDQKPPSAFFSEGVGLYNLKGDKFVLSGSAVGKPILLVFWSVTCASCIEEIPFISSLSDTLGDKALVVGVHQGGMPVKLIARFLKKNSDKINYSLAFDNDNALFSMCEVSVMPAIKLINPNGDTLYSHVGYAENQNEAIKNEIISKL